MYVCTYVRTYLHGFAILWCSLIRQLRKIMVQRMAKPEEVIVVENEQGEVVREVIKDTDAMNLYKSMRESLGRQPCDAVVLCGPALWGGGVVAAFLLFVCIVHCSVSHSLGL